MDSCRLTSFHAYKHISPFIRLTEIYLFYFFHFAQCQLIWWHHARSFTEFNWHWRRIVARMSLSSSSSNICVRIEFWTMLFNQPILIIGSVRFFFVASILCGFGICCKIREFKCILFVNFLRVISCIREWQNFREVLCFFKPIDERNRIVSVSNHLLITLGTLFVH